MDSELPQELAQNEGGPGRPELGERARHRISPGLPRTRRLAFQELDELDSEAQIKRAIRFRDTLPRQADGRRQRTSGKPDLVNLADRNLREPDEEQKTKPPELECVTFAERERDALLKRGRKIGLPPKEYQYLKLWAQNPRISYTEAARKLETTKTSDV